MATLATDIMTYADWAKRVDSSGKVGEIVEILNQSNPILDDMLVKECNDGTGHKTTVRTGLPRAAWRMLNYGVPKVKTQTAQVRDTTGMLEVYSECDKKLADLSGNQNSFRMSEAIGIMEGMSQQMAETVFYGNTNVNPERFTGLSPRYSTGVVADAASAANVINAGGVGAQSNSSIWIVTWSDRATHGLFPKGSKAGLDHRDLGEDTLKDDSGGQYQGYRDWFGWDCGLTVRNWQHNIRIANVDMTKLNDITYIKTLITHLINASEKLPVVGEDKVAEGGAGRRVIYMNPLVRGALRNAILEKIAGNLTWETVAGKRVMQFDDMPIHRVDALLSTEAPVPFA